MYRSGFTLLEVIVVVALLSIIASIVGVQVLKEPDEQKPKIAGIQMERLSEALGRYRMAHGSYPTEQQGLMALVKEPDVDPPEGYPPQGYLSKKRLPADPWGNQYIYNSPGREGADFEIVCYGSDGKPGGEGKDADISSLGI